MHFSNLVEIIKARRASLNVTQETLAELSGVGLRTLKQFESGKRESYFDDHPKSCGCIGP